MVMPFGKRDTGSKAPHAPETIDFDALWDRAFRPALTDLGFAAVRGDDGSLTENILRDILENLALSELVVADVTAVNANAFYEVGVRHAVPGNAKCVLLAAQWAQPPFDVQGMRQVRYPFPKEDPTDADYERVRRVLIERIPVAQGFDTPMSLVADYPYPERTDAKAFEKRMGELEEFQARVRKVRLEAKVAQKAAARALLERYAPKSGSTQARIPSVVSELIAVARDCVGWKETLDLIRALPAEVRSTPHVEEQELLAEAKLGDARSAIPRLEQLIERHGSTPEREGLIAGRWKQVFSAATDADEREEALDRAIEHYTRGMELDLNPYYCSSNLPRRLRQRGRPGDEQQARAIVPLAMLAAERALRRNANDRWAALTLLGTSIDAGDVAKARECIELVRKAKPAAWEAEITLEDAQISLAQQAVDVQRELAPIVDLLRRLAAPKA
jgi:hypothetical protein